MHCIEHVKCIKRDVYILLPLKVKYYKTNDLYPTASAPTGHGK